MLSLTEDLSYSSCNKLQPYGLTITIFKASLKVNFENVVFEGLKQRCKPISTDMANKRISS